MSNYVKIYGQEQKREDPADQGEPEVPIDSSTIKVTSDSSLKADLKVDTFKKLEDCPQTFNITKTNSAIDNSILFVNESTILDINGDVTKYTYIYNQDGFTSGTKRYVYLGFKDSNDKFTGNYKENEIVFDTDTTGCSAKSTLYTSIVTDNKNTGGLITYSLNRCTEDRIITFNYNSIPIFKINQKYYTAPKEHAYVYAIYINNYTANSTYAWVGGDLPNLITYSKENTLLSFQPSLTDGNYVFFYYTKSAGTFAIGLKVSQILNHLTHVEGNDELSGYGNYYYTSIPTSINSWNTVTLTSGTISTSITSPIGLYKQSGGNSYVKVATITISETSEYYHLGKYEQDVT